MSSASSNHASLNHPDGAAGSSRRPTPDRHSRSPARPSDRNDDSGDRVHAQRTKYTVTACARCRQRKSRCDAGLPRCHQCERSGSRCEYWDATKSRLMPRQYIVELQDRVKALQKELAELEGDESQEPDPETLVREAAVVRFEGSDETKYLGASSGTTMTRILLQLAKKVTKSDSIKDIITEERSRKAQSRRALEENKPTSKDVDYTYPLTSQSAAPQLVPRELADVLLRVFNMKVQTMYPVFHEPTLHDTFSSVYAGSTDPYKNFVVRMVTAIALQRGHTRYAGLADSFYLAAMSNFEAVVSQMDLHTLQCFILIGEYSLLTPTRTAVFYVVGLAVRLAQALGICDSSTLCVNADGSEATEYEVDIRRRLFWAVVTMDYGLAHSLGRPSMMATSQEHINVDYFKPVDDQYITPDGILQGPFSKRKWIAIHFYKMRILQLEIRRTLYQRKRPTPQSEEDPWFKQMERKLAEWRDASPDDQAGEDSGFNKIWFHGRYHTMIVFLFRPSPQIPRPTARAAIFCYEACEFNIDMQRKQIETKSVETTWAFTQSLFMAVNTILWTLSYAEVRRIRTREQVASHLDTALEAMKIASIRWPGVSSALELYDILISATLRIYDAEGDIPVTANSPFDSDRMSAGSGTDPPNGSRTTSPVLRNAGRFSGPMNDSDFLAPGDSARATLDVSTDGNRSRTSSGSYLSAPSPQWMHAGTHAPTASRLSHPQFNPMPSTFSEMSSWQFSSATHHRPSLGHLDYFPMIGPLVDETGGRPASDAGSTVSDFHNVWTTSHPQQGGLTSDQQESLVRDLGANGIQDFENMISESASQLYQTANGMP